MLPVTDLAILIRAALYLGLIFLVGYSVVCSTLKTGKRHWVELIGLSYAAGAGVLSLLLFTISIVGFKPNLSILIGLLIVAISAIVLLRKIGRIQTPTVPQRRHESDVLTILGFVGAGVIVTTAGNITAHAAWPGLQDIDAFAIWMLKAKWVALDALRPMPGVFHDPILSYSHQDYPLSLPLLVAGLYAAIGRIDDNAAKLLLLPTWFALVAILYGAIRRFHRRAMALAITALFAAAPTLSSNASLLVAETPLLLALTAAISMLLSWMEEGDRGDLLLAGLFTAIAAFTKNEGLALLPVIGVGALLVACRRAKGLADFIRAAALCAIAIAPWLIYRSFLPRTHEDYGSKLLSPAILIHNFSDRSHIVTDFFMRLFDAPRAGLIWYVLVLTTFINPRTFLRRSTCVLWFILLIQLSLYLATFMVTPWQLTVLVPMITPKLQTQASEIAGLLIAMSLRPSRV